MKTLWLSQLIRELHLASKQEVKVFKLLVISFLCSKEADLPFGRMGMVGLEPVYGIYPAQPVGASSCRRKRRKSLGDSYVYKVNNKKATV